MIHAAQAYVGINAKAILLNWEHTSRQESDRYNVYINKTGSFELNATTEEPECISKPLEAGNYEVMIKAVDFVGNKSEPSEITSVTIK